MRKPTLWFGDLCFTEHELVEGIEQAERHGVSLAEIQAAIDLDREDAGFRLCMLGNWPAYPQHFDENVRILHDLAGRLSS